MQFELGEPVKKDQVKAPPTGMFELGEPVAPPEPSLGSRFRSSLSGIAEKYLEPPDPAIRQYNPLATDSARAKPSSPIDEVKEREPTKSEVDYFKNNPNVSGMATSDSAVILNSFSTLSDQEKAAVLTNEKSRVYMRSSGTRPDFALTQKQKRAFSDYGSEQDIKETIAARILSGDPSAGEFTQEQQRWVDDNLSPQEQSAITPEELGLQDVPEVASGHWEGVEAAERRRKHPNLMAGVDTIKGALYGDEGLPEGLGYLQKPAEKVVDWLFEDIQTPEEEQKMAMKHPNLMAARHAAIKILLPGITEKIFSAEDREAFLALPPDTQRAEIIGTALGYSLFAGAFRGAKPAAAWLADKYPKQFGWLIRDFWTFFKGKKGNKAWFRDLSDFDKGRVAQGMKAMREEGVSDAEILNVLKKRKVAPFSEFVSKKQASRTIEDIEGFAEATKAAKSPPREPLPPERGLPAPERGFRMAGEHERWSPEVAKKMAAGREATGRALSPGQGFVMQAGPRPTTRALPPGTEQPKALPAGQGFVLGEPVEPKKPTEPVLAEQQEAERVATEVIEERAAAKPPELKPAKPSPEVSLTEQAVRIGERATPKDIERLKADYETSKDKVKELRAAKKFDDAFIEAQKGQGFREAIEAAEGKLVRTKEGGLEYVELKPAKPKKASAVPAEPVKPVEPEPKPAEKVEAKEPTPVKEIEAALKSRRVKGDNLLDALDLADDLAEKNAEISKDGIVTLYHRTSKSGAEEIIRSGRMVSKEDRLFFGTQPTGQIEGYGDAVVRVYIPLEKLELNDVFSGEAHVTMKSGRIGTAITIKVEAWKPLPKPSPASEVGAQEVPARPSPGSVFIGGKQFPFREYYEFTKGKNEGRIRVTLPDGKKKVVEKADVAKWPEGVEKVEADIKVTGPKEAKKVTVELPKKEAEALKPAEQKKYLLAEIDKAIKEGENERGFGEGWVTIHVPGDGDFKVWNTRNALEVFKKQARGFPSQLPKKPVYTRISPRSVVREENRYKGIIGKSNKPEDIKPADIDGLLKNAASWEVATQDFSLHGFANWLLGKDIKPEVVTKLRESLRKDYIKEAWRDELARQKRGLAEATKMLEEIAPIVEKMNRKEITIKSALEQTGHKYKEHLIEQYGKRKSWVSNAERRYKELSEKLAEPKQVSTVDAAKSRIVSALKDQRGSFSMKQKEGPAVYEDLLTVGKHYIEQGHTKWSSFRLRMIDALSEIWDKVRGVISRVFVNAKKILKSEKGAVTIKGERKEKLSKYQADNIAWEPHKLDLSKEGLKNLAAKVYTTFKMGEYPVVRLAKRAGKEATEVVENQIRRLRGKGGIVEEMLTGKGPFRIINYGTEKEAVQYVKDAKSLKDILSPLKLRQEYIDYETLRVAERDVALATHRPDIKGTDIKASQAEIERLETKYSPEDITRLRKISEEHRTFERQAVLRPLVDIGWMSKKSYDAIIARPESEYYASFAREMDEVESYALGGKDPVKRIRGSEKKKVPSVEATIANVYKTIKLVETIRLNKEIVKLRELSPELEELITEVKPQYITKDVPERPGPRGGTKVSVRSPIQPKQTIIVPIDGAKHFWKVPPDVHKALDYYSPREMSTVIKVMSIPAKWLRAGATLSAEFIARNPVRDQLSAYVYSNYGYKPLWDFGKGIFHILKKTDVYHEFKASGAEQAYFVSVDRQALKVNTRQVVGWKAATVKDVVGVMNPLAALQTISMWAEKGTRIGAFAKARKKGAMPSQAMAEAREVTLDFMRLGTERALNQVIAFWNANIEGTDRMARSFKDHPYRTSWRVLLGITVPSIILWALYHDNERIKALPDWRKNFCWNIPIPGGPIISIPKPFELGIIFGSLPERILDHIAKDDPEAMRSIAKAVKDGGAPGLIPTAALPIVENIANYSFFMDRPLEGEALQDLPKGMRAGTYSSELAKRTGKITNLSPVKIDNWIRAWTGTLGKQTLDLLDPVFEESSIPKPEKRWYEIAPGIKGFVAKEPIGGAGVDVERFYRNMQKCIEAANGYKVLLVDNPKEARELDKETQGIKKYAGVARMTATNLGLCSKRKVRVMKSSMTSKAKRQRIDEINRQMTDYAKKFNNRIGK